MLDKGLTEALPSRVKKALTTEQKVIIDRSAGQLSPSERKQVKTLCKASPTYTAVTQLLEHFVLGTRITQRFQESLPDDRSVLDHIAVFSLSPGVGITTGLRDHYGLEVFFGNGFYPEGTSFGHYVLSNFIKNGGVIKLPDDLLFDGQITRRVKILEAPLSNFEDIYQQHNETIRPEHESLIVVYSDHNNEFPSLVDGKDVTAAFTA